MVSANELFAGIVLPLMICVRQDFPDESLAAPALALREQLDQPEIASCIRPGMRIAITAGSRGLNSYLSLMRELVSFLKSRGARPFLIPAMGSHGGAFAKGQEMLLERYGITEESTGAPIYSSMEVVQAGQTESGEPVWVDKYAWEADGIILMNRIKPHTGFHGDYESGLVKMAAIGLGKQRGAETVHSRGPAQMAARVKEFGLAAIQHCRILFGVATVENSYDKVCDVRVIPANEIVKQEPVLLKEAKRNMPRILFENLDVLIVDQIGKNISGPGMDPNITHTYLPEAPISQELRSKRAKRVVVLDLTEETHGTAMGIGMADITTRRLFAKIDLASTYANCLTGGVTASAKLPMMFDNDRDAILAAVKTLTNTDRSGLRIVRIQDTLHLEKIWISAALLPEAQAHSLVRILLPEMPFAFDERGNLF